MDGSASGEGWVPDVLGDEFERLTLPLGADDEGEVVATLVRALPRRTLRQRVFGDRRPLADVDVLYVHGWSDYFFQKRLARFWTARGARFFALDLRKYGRSLRPGQTPGYISGLDEYDADIAAALAAVGIVFPDGGKPEAHAQAETDEGEVAPAAAPDTVPPARTRRLVVLGHSTGGLILSLWAARHPGVADAVILNSPWLEFQLPRLTRETIAPLVGLQARYRPLERAPQLDLGFYTRAQNEVADPDDPMDIELGWRPEQTMAVHAGWLHAILAGHAAVAGGIRIDAPVCVLLSARSALPTAWSEELTRVDSVLVVDDIARAALKLGPSVTIERIDGALHDVFLSRHESRDEAYERLGRWVAGWAAAHPR
ncbi:alpha-beta hydrolase superfamily lysophospholipase [Microbacterium resistens]|uniref:Alpha-beta hydrolase superfamily lysophospholipase n=1 Tax=Microbacterium resistens TaxID=156977 RepID=A0ABU1SCR2_9MICO|nr:alpha/beta hydrolase [Microbacterium resistens]MDR6866693.1 alpha-beta hydrolase superfamily lysophospholipase [Microbacterium resistens]